MGLEWEVGCCPILRREAVTMMRIASARVSYSIEPREWTASQQAAVAEIRRANDVKGFRLRY